MKRIFSLLLAALMLVSAVPTTFAINDYTAGTRVEYTASGSESYTITVPAQLAPGGSGTVTLSGTWADNRIVTVTADPTVTLTNSIKADDQKVLNVNFAGIAEAGSNTTSQTFTESVSVDEISNALFGTWSGKFNYNVGIDSAPSIEYLQSKYEFEYYSTLNGAVNDVNNGTIGTNADANKEDAVAGIYTNAGQTYVVLLKDTTEATRVKTTVDMTINLGGHTLSTNDKVGINLLSGNLVIDGRLSGSTILMKQTSGNNAKAIQLTNTGNCTINGGTYISNSEYADGSCIALYDTSNISISNAKIYATETNGKTRALEFHEGTSGNINNCEITAVSTTGTFAIGIRVDGNISITDCNITSMSGGNFTNAVEASATATLTIINCDITATATNGDSCGLQNLNGASATVTNCNIRAYSNYFADGNTYTASSHGVNNHGTLTINDCYVMGTHSGVQNVGTLYVDGGTFESYGHGGIYFGGPGTTSYVRNATLKDSLTMPEGWEGTSQHNGAGFYIGGFTGQDNISVYMDNCNIYGSASQIVLRGSSGEKNNTLYISNSNIYDLDGNTLSVRIDNDTHKLYLGTGNNFTADNTNRPSAVITTNETYIYNG